LLAGICLSQVGQQPSSERVECVDEFDTGPLAFIPGLFVAASCLPQIVGHPVNRRFKILGLAGDAKHRVAHVAVGGQREDWQRGVSKTLSSTIALWVPYLKPWISTTTG